ncbi:transposase [Acinetobacter venetianus]
MYSDTEIQCFLMIKVLFLLTLRITTGFVQTLTKVCILD